MNIDHLLCETATVTSRVPTSTQDAYGVVQTTAATRTTICLHQQSFSGESGSIVERTFNAYFPPDDPLLATDKVTIDGTDFEVIGGPWPTLNPRTGDAWQVEATLRRTDG